MFAQGTLALIDQGGPFPCDKDGVIFQNREGILPDQDDGYYAEYTVLSATTCEGPRGALRIVTGDGGEYYWTEDHYESFERILRGGRMSGLAGLSPGTCAGGVPVARGV